MRHVLRNGAPVVVRPVRPSDAPALALGLTRLSAASAYRRFLTPKTHFSSAELRYLTEVDGRDHVALVAVLADAPEVLVASGRWVRDVADPGTAEVAIVVADHLQGQGLGSALGRELAEAARAHGVRRFSALMLPDNTPALRLFRAIGGHLDQRVAHGVRELVAELGPVPVGAAA